VSVLPTISEQFKVFNLYSRISQRPQTVFGFAARLEHEKGPALLVDATAIVNRQEPMAVARFAGTGTELPKVKERARELALGDNCEFVGHYTDPLGRSAFMNSLDVFVLPSFAEGTPNSIMEAMSHGLPVIASDVGGIADMIGDDAGLLVPPGDVNALAMAMSRLASDPALREQMGKSAKDRYQELFSPAAVVPLLLDTYERLMANGRAPAVTQNGHHPWANHSRTNISNSQ
jgi:glycosyltransferase involved in cell wall biosynthesis